MGKGGFHLLSKCGLASIHSFPSSYCLQSGRGRIQDLWILVSFFFFLSEARARLPQPISFSDSLMLLSLPATSFRSAPRLSTSSTRSHVTQPLSLLPSTTRERLCHSVQLETWVAARFPVSPARAAPSLPGSADLVTLHRWVPCQGSSVRAMAPEPSTELQRGHSPRGAAPGTPALLRLPYGRDGRAARKGGAAVARATPRSRQRLPRELPGPGGNSVPPGGVALSAAGAAAALKGRKQAPITRILWSLSSSTPVSHFHTYITTLFRASVSAVICLHL